MATSILQDSNFTFPARQSAQTGEGQGPYLFKDINTGKIYDPHGYSSGLGSYPSNLTNVNGTLFFGADDGTHDGPRLWTSNGTEDGTFIITDISNPSNLTSVNGTLFFTATENTPGEELGTELWKSEGTENGTVLVKDINPDFYSSDPSNLTNVNGTLFFTADDGTHGKELWKSDGTEAGTVLVKDINLSSNSSFPWGLTNVNGTLFFTAYDGRHGKELWKSDGTEAGTVLVKDINSGSSQYGPYGSFPGDLTNVNGTLFFTADDGTHGKELWKSDGTENGTVLVKDINPSSNSSFSGGLTKGSNSSFSEGLTNVNGTLFFTADDGTHGRELWKSDGTEAGTVLVKDINSGSSQYGPYGSFLWGLTNVNGTLFFTADDGTHGRELWKSDGTEAGTVLVKDINPSSNSSFPWVPWGLTNVNGTLFFGADDGTHGRELWKSDGTEAGTVLVKDINPDFYSSDPDPLTNVNGTLFFTADDGTHGRELWALTGQAIHSSNANLKRLDADNSVTIAGLGSKDFLVSDAGRDILTDSLASTTFGIGDDNLAGGRSADIFVLSAGDGTDTISDFKQGTDLIGLAGGLTLGQLPFSGANILLPSNEVLATLTGVNTSTLTPTDFTTFA